MIMGHIKNLLMNAVREALSKLQSQGVGYIDLESYSTIYYCIDEKWYAINVSEVDEEDVKAD